MFLVTSLVGLFTHWLCFKVVIAKTFDELYQYIKQKNLTIDFSGTLQHDYRTWLAVQKVYFK